MNRTAGLADERLALRVAHARCGSRLKRSRLAWLGRCLLLSAMLVAAHSAQAAVTFRAGASASASGVAIGYGGQGTAANRGNCGSINPGLPAGTGAGDLLVALVSAGAQPTITMTGWNQLFLASGAATETAAIYWRVATGGDPNTITQSGTCNVLIGRISRFTGVDTAQPFQTAPLVAANYSYQNAATVTSGSVTTTFAGAMLVFTAHSTDDDTFGALAGFTQAYTSSTGTGNDAAIGLYYAAQAAAGAAGPYTVTKNRGADPNHGTVFALRPAPPTLTINKPAGTVTADVMVASVAVTLSAVTITPPAGWTQVTGSPVVQGSATSSRLATFYRVAGVGEPSSYTWTFSASHGGAVGGILSFSGVDNTAPIDAQAGTATVSGTNHTAPSVTTTENNGMLVTAHELTSSRTWTPPGGMTEAVDIASLAPSNAGGISMEMNYEARPTAGATGPRTASVGGNADSGATQSVSLKPTPLICYTDDFNRANGSPGDDWVVSSSSGGFGNPVIFNNRLRLTDATGNVATMATLQRLFPGSGNRIEVEFDHFSYGGSGADGIALAFSDSGVAPVPGGYGGSLGYAQRTGINGFAGGWLGVGIDEFGNYSNPTEGRQGGPGFRVDSVAVRGSGSGAGATYGTPAQPNYAYHAGTNTLTPQVDNNGAASPPHRYRIIVDHQNSVNAFASVERDTGAGYVTLVPAYDAKAQAGQANVPTAWLLSYTGSTGGSTNIHEIDSLQICATQQTPLSGIHHFEITVSPTPSTCQATTVTIVAKDINDNTITDYTGTVDILTSSSHGDWFGTVNGTLNNGVAYPPGDDNGAATYTFAAADQGAVTLSFWNTHADDMSVIVTDPTVPSTGTTSSTMSFRNSAFVVAPSPAQSPIRVIAGRPQDFTVTLTGAGCTPDTNYTGSRNLDAWLTRDPLDPSGTAPTINSVSLPSAAPASNPASNNLPNITFNSGVATLTLATTDVGRYVLNVRDDTRTYANAVDLGGASASITVGPWFHVTVTGNPANSGTGGAVFTSAGTAFGATVRAVQWQGADDGNNDGVPDTGANLSDNATTPSYAWATALSAASPHTPAAGTLGNISNGSIAQASFSGGSATIATPAYGEVGSFTMRATAADYLNAAASGVDFATTHGVVGRFTPAYFNVAATHACVAGNFTYSGQAFATVVVTPYSATGGAINNYRTAPFGFAKNVTISNSGDASNFSGNTVAESAFTGANGSSSTVVYTFPVKDTAPAALTLRAIDTDGISSATGTEASMQVRSGRLQMQNVFGSELVALSMPAIVQYYQDAANGWATNGADTCSSVGSITLNNANGPVTFSPPATGSITVRLPAHNTTATLTGTSPSLGLGFTAPGGSGYVDASADLSTANWLRYDWDGNGTHDNDPSGRATFGIYRGSPRHIYRRERF